MKKIFLSILFILFFCCSFIKVDALTNKGMLYEVGYQSAGVNVFAKDTTYNSMDYNGWYVKSTVDDAVYYCIEPEVYMQNTTDAKANTHTIYKGEDIVKYSRLNEEEKNYISLLAYYGYKYPGHEDKKWYGITQVLIWQKLRPDITWKFKKSRYGETANLYTKEVKELKDLVAKHNILPSFSEDNIKASLNTELVLEDTNNVLSNFVLEENDLNAKIIGNKLVINPSKAGEYTLSFKQRRVNYDFALFHSVKLQDLVTRGDVSYQDFTLKVTVGGKIIFHKQDQDTKTFVDEEDFSLVGTELVVIDKNTSLEVAKIKVDKATVTLPLETGDYLIKEVKAGLGYNLSDEEVVCKIDETSPICEITFYNTKKKGDFTFKKYYKNIDASITLEKDAIFKVTDLNNKEVLQITTDANGLASFTLPIGKYYLEQIAGSTNYQWLAKQEIEIKEGENYEEYYDLEKSSLELIKYDADGKTLLKDCLIGLYDQDMNLIASKKTNALGQVLFEHLDLGTYYLKELEAPPYYLKDERVLEVKVDKYHQKYQVTFENSKEEYSFKILKIDTDTKEALAGAQFSIYNLNDELVYQFSTLLEPVTIKLPFGEYYLVEEVAPFGYEVSKKKIPLSLYANKEEIIYLENKKIVNPETGDSIKIYLSSLILSLSLLSICLKKSLKTVKK